MREYRSMRMVNVAAAQMGPIHKADSREAVVARMLDLIDEAEGEACDLVVYPELALTTFFPRWYMTDRPRSMLVRARNAERGDPPAVRGRRASRIAITFGYAELTPDGHHFNTSILADREGEDRRQISQGPSARPSRVRSARAPSSIWRSAISSPATSAFRCGARWAASSACASATTAAGPRPIA